MRLEIAKWASVRLTGSAESQGSSGGLASISDSSKKELEICTNCGRTIGRLQEAYAFKGKIVCGECDKKLRNVRSEHSSENHVDEKPYEAGIADEAAITTIGNLAEAAVKGGWVIYAGFWRRFFAFFLDLIFLLLVFLFLVALNLTWFFPYISFMIFSWIYYSIMESSPWQATLGKKEMDIIVTDENGNRLSFMKASCRHFAKIISTILLFGGFAVAAFTKKKQALHDIMTDCLVILKPDASMIYLTGSKVENGMVSFACVNCGAELQARESLIGNPEVCPHCKSVTMVTDIDLSIKLVKKRSILENLKPINKGLSRLFIVLIALYAILNAKGIAPPIVGVLIGSLILGIAAFGVKLERIERNWLFKVSEKLEQKRHEVCETILELRNSGKDVRLCTRCIGAGKYFRMRCKKCLGHGYLEY